MPRTATVQRPRRVATSTRSRPCTPSAATISREPGATAGARWQERGKQSTHSRRSAGVRAPASAGSAAASASASATARAMRLVVEPICHKVA